MAIFHFDIRPIKRSADQKATAAAAYRAGERIEDLRAGTVHDHSRRKDVAHKEIFLPSQLDASKVKWGQDRGSLWNAAEQAEPRRNSRVAREFEVALPPELGPQQRLALARSFARELSDRYGIAVDLAVHDPKPGGDPRNFHAHLLATTREVTPDGLGQKAGLDMQAVKRASLGLPDHSEEYAFVRERWATLTNEMLREANIDARVDHRTLAAQGIERRPMVHVPMEFYRSKGVDTETLARIREDYRARVAARLERSGNPEHAPNATPAQQKDATIDRMNVEEIRRRAVQSWLRMRSKGAESSQKAETSQERATSRASDRSADNPAIPRDIDDDVNM
jgi:ATP-dependent exoDNAse (exonuclease V) alpha subunit